MANILYGVNGEGAGHSTRAKEVLSHLVAKGHVVRRSFDRDLRNNAPRQFSAAGKLDTLLASYA